MPEHTELRKSSKLKTLDKVLVFLSAFLSLFVIAMVVTFWKFQSVPDSLIVAVLGSGTSEAILTCIITCVKKKAGIKDE